MALQKNGSVNRSLLRPSLFIYNVYKVQNSINHMLNPSADRDVNNIYQLSTEKARQWWNNQAFESRKNIVIESDAVINEDELIEDQTIADIADKEYDDLPDITKQEVELQVEDEEDMEELFEVKDDEYLKCSICEEIFTTNEDYELHKSVDHGEEPEDFEESEETYQLTMHPELTRESLRKANNLLTETEERQIYSGYDKNGDVQSSIMPYNLPPVATGKYNDNPNEFFYSNKIFRAGSSTERTSSLGESLDPKETESTICVVCGRDWDNHSNPNTDYRGTRGDAPSTDHYFLGGDIEYGLDKYGEARATEYTMEDLERVGIEWDNSSVAEKKEIIIDTHNGYTEGHDDNIVKNWNELSDHTRTVITQGKSNESTDRFEADIENDQVIQKLPDDKRSFDVEAKLPRQMDFKTGGYAGKNEWGGDATLCEICGTKFNTYPEFLDHYQTHDEANGPEFYESKASEKGEWDWLDKGADSKSVDYDEVEYKDDGVSDISIQNAEPKLKDQNAFLDNVNIGVESVDYVYKTKAYEAMEKTYIPVSETFEEDYEEFEDSDEAMIKETITLRKLTGYGDDAIARELNINYGVSHEEALEKVYSVEVSTNDRVSQTFFGKMYKECTESEKDELRMYSGSD